MIIVLCIVLFILFCIGSTRYFILHLFNLLPLLFADFIAFLRHPREFRKFGVVMYCGYMGQGKTIKAVDDVLYFKKTYPNINVYSNIHIACDYKQITSWDDIVNAPPNSIFLIDEVSTLLHARNWKDFPVDLMRTLFQSRKNHKYMIMTAQRFHHVDKTVRDITDRVFQQYNDFWRIHHTTVYDAWEMENCSNLKDLVPLARYWWHRSNRMYRQYDTSYVVQEMKKYDYISNDDIINRQGIHSESLSNSYKNKKFNKKFAK